ncbi:WSC domain-containing protein [Lophiotrema nucula]|uniref:WSC domain-containing protein n=1 Tax=Lophiotrema nucula TaxID=690887 RepID=A0A6A5YPX0_9PLEO|nr:WSC domain-containing protein [Lophiotrema nucula]
MPSIRFRPLPMRSFLLALTNLFFVVHISALADTDTVTWGGDNTRAGYQTNHNMDPNVVSGSDFGQIFKTLLPGNFNNLGPEQIYSQPLVYTGDDGVQYVYIATTQNNIYKLNAKTGAIVANRNLHVPFLQVELESCVDINPMIGVTATGVIDPTTGIWYLTAKTYADRFQDGNFSPTNPPGRLNGCYWQHAVHTEDLSEAKNWPVLIDGTVFRNNPNRMFIGGNQHSRPGALLVGDYVYTGYASHCIQYNYTGAIIGFNKTSGKIIEAFATQGGPEPNTVKGGGIWMSGGGLAYDGKGSMYFATGNGYASQLKATGNSVPGRSPPTSLEEAAVNAKINDDGTLTVTDFFMPWEKTQLDGADRDLGTSPLVILPSDVFSCPNHRRIGVVTGKTGKTYWLNLDNLGGYQNGPNALDAVIQTFQNENSVYAGAGVLPLGGGYIYIPVTQYQTHVFQFSCNSAGNAVFTKVGDTPEKNAYILGTGHGTTTSLDGQEGTGLLWISDAQGPELRIYDPIPPGGSGPLNLLNSFQIDAVTKFTRPVFGDGTVYIGTTKGYLYGFGNPSTPALNCSAPASFGNLIINSASTTMTVTCTALITINLVNNITLDSNSFNLSNAPFLPFTLSIGRSFSFNVTFAPVNVGSQSDDIVISTTNAQAGYSGTIRVTLRGTGQSLNPLLAIVPNIIQFNAIAGNPSDEQTSLFWNFGDTLLTFTNISFSQVSASGPWVAPTTTTDGNLQVGNFVFVSLPTTLPAGSSASIGIIYSPSVPGNDTVYVKGFSDGGTAVLNVYGTAGTNPKAVIEFQTTDGSGWVSYSNTSPFTFGTVYEATGRILKMRIRNGGGSNAVPLSITVSKPPYGIPGIIGKSNNIDLAEGTTIFAAQSQSADMFCSVPKSQVNVPSYNGFTVWTLNTNDPNLGKLDIQFFCNAVAGQVGPLLSNGSASWPYVGCFKENNPGRQLATLAYSDTANQTDGRCISTCASAGWIFAGTQYSQECWCGNAIPIQLDPDSACNYGCTGNVNQTCGGDGILHDTPHMSLFADSTKFNGNTTSPPLLLTPNVGMYNFIGCYADVSGKTLTTKQTTSNIMTVEACQAYCSAYTYFGLEFSAECYCGNALNSASTVQNSTQCNMPCKGSNSEYCGASNRMQVYQANRILPSSSIASSLFVGIKWVYFELVIRLDFLYVYIALIIGHVINEFFARLINIINFISLEHFFDNSVDYYTCILISRQHIKWDRINIFLNNCGFQHDHDIYWFGSYNYVGCWAEASAPLISGRAINALGIYKNTTSMTPSLCAAYCFQYAYFGVEYSTECWCGPYLNSNTSIATNQADCNMPCSGDSTQICGAALRLSLYRSTDPSKTSTDPVVPGPKIGNYSYAYCSVDSASNTRLLGTQLVNDTMSTTTCLAAAEAGNYAYAGLEYGRECWLGNTLSGNNTVTGNVRTAEDDCKLTCVGARGELCGGASRLNLWVRNVTGAEMGTRTPRVCGHE